MELSSIQPIIEIYHPEKEFKKWYGSNKATLVGMGPAYIREIYAFWESVEAIAFASFIVDKRHKEDPSVKLDVSIKNNKNGVEMLLEYKPNRQFVFENAMGQGMPLDLMSDILDKCWSH